jgi:hypothetical protein
MRTITTEVGSGSIKAVTCATDESAGSYAEEEIDNSTEVDLGERIEAPIPENDNITSSLDERCERTTDFNFKSGDVPNGTIINTVDNGPDLNPANDNDALTRDNIANSPKACPLKEMFERGDLGISEIENRHHWFDAE